jgi:flagellar hook-length control protein FliK
VLTTDTATSTPPLAGAVLSAAPAQLTTIPLSPSINIITTAQSQPDDKSVADFALAMGLDPSQVQALFGQTTSAKPLQNNVSTQQMLGMNSMPIFNAPGLQKDASLSAVQLPLESLNLTTAVSTADFQALKDSAPTLEASANSTLNALSNLNIQLATAQLTPNATAAMPVSTLAVLSMMDADLRPEDIDALKNEFDALAPTTDVGGLGMADHGTGASAVNHAQLPAKAAAVLANNPNMAQTFDKLSEKLATELASRMNDQLNAGEWKMKFALKPASLGLVDVQLEMRDGRLTAQFNADTSLTQDLIQNGSQRLKEALGQLGRNNASVLVGQGQTQQQSQSGQSGQSGMPSRRDDNRVTLADETAPDLRTTAKPRHSNSLQFDNYA